MIAMTRAILERSKWQFQFNLSICPLLQTDPIEFDPSVVCFGGYKAKPAGKVSIAPHGISIEVESPPDPTENVMVTIEWAYIVKSIFARGDKTAFLFRTLITFVERIESALRFYELRLRDPSLGAYFVTMFEYRK